MKAIARYFIAVLLFSAVPTWCGAFGFFDGRGASGLEWGSRWDSQPRIFDGVERSLVGGLRFSMQGGSYEAYRDLLSWEGEVPSVAAFEQAVLDAFAVWTATDPETGLDTMIRFVPDLGTPTSLEADDSTFIRFGSEIDIMASTNYGGWTQGNSETQGRSDFSAKGVSGDMTLTSGVSGYGGFAISGADIVFNNNTGARYTLTSFRSILAHEIGHALGFADIDTFSGPGGTFVDDNYDGSSDSSARATLTNSFAGLIDPANPSLSPLVEYVVANASPGVDTPGVDILMESRIPEIFFGPGAFPRMMNDDFAGRQFLYPVSLEPEMVIVFEGPDVVLSWQDAAGWSLEESPDLGAWSPAPVGALQGGVRTVRVPALGRGFFRLRRFSP